MATVHEQIQELEKQGLKVRVRHYRLWQEAVLTPDEIAAMPIRERIHYLTTTALPAWKLREKGLTPTTRGGYTVVRVKRGRVIVCQGKAICSPLDTFDKKLALTKALGRALGAEKREERAKRHGNN